MKSLFYYFQRIDKIWRLIWVFIFCGFISLDLFFPKFFGVTFLKLLGIGLCLIYVAQKHFDDKYLLLAFCCTFVADLLLAVNNTSLFGVFVFAMAQFLHFTRLKRLTRSYIFIGGGIITALFLISAALGPYGLVLLGSIYAFFLISNIIISVKWHKKARGKQKNPALCALSGFILFACCDTCVALSFFSGIHALPFVFKRVFDFSAWFFYYPSQVLLSNSSRLTKKVEIDR